MGYLLLSLVGIAMVVGLVAIHHWLTTIPVNSKFDLRALAKFGKLELNDGTFRDLTIVDAEIIYDELYAPNRDQLGIATRFWGFEDFVYDLLWLNRDVLDILKARIVDPSENDVDRVTPWEDIDKQREHGWNDL